MLVPGFVGEAYVAESPWADQEDLWNWYPEPVESQGGSTRVAYYPTPGFTELSDAGSGTGSAHFAQSGREFAIIGTTFYEVAQYGGLTNRGTVATNANPGTITSNGDGGGQLFITSGGNGYVYDLTANTLTPITALAGIATIGGMLDGYFICLDVTTSTVFISDLLDGSTWDPTNYFQRSIAPDPWVSMIVANRYIYMFGTETSEVWYDAGTFPIPFAPHPSGLFQFGCAASFSPEVIGTAVCWLAKTVNGSGAVMKVSGFSPEAISNFATEKAFNGYTIEDAVGDAYEENGHLFYVLTFRQSGATWCYDDSTGNWHRRGTWNSMTGEFDAMSAMYHAFSFGENRMLDLNSGKVYDMSISHYLGVGGAYIRRVRRAPALFQENKRVYVSSFEADFETGLGVQSGQGSDPMVMLRVSKDGGKTFGKELTTSAGAVGKYGTRVKFNRMGMGRRMVFEVAVSDPIPWKLLNAYVEISPSADIPQSQGRAA